MIMFLNINIQLSPEPETAEDLAKKRAELTKINREKFRLYASGELEKQLMVSVSSMIVI